METKLYEYIHDVFLRYGCYIELCKGGHLCIAMPLGYSTIPVCKNIKDHKRCTLKNIKSYFDTLRCKYKNNVVCINGVPTNPACVDNIACTLCRRSVVNKYCRDYYYCYTSHNYICKKCWECNAICNCGEDVVSTAHHSSMVHREALFREVCCDNCHKCITSSTLVCITDKSKKYAPMILCTNCLHYDEAFFVKSIHMYRQYTNPLITYYEEMDFGSMLDWVPVLHDKAGCMVLVNVNCMSKLHSQVCLACPDAAGRYGYFTLDKHVSLGNVVSILLALTSQKKWKKCKKNHRFPNYPIKKLMQNQGMPTDYSFIYKIEQPSTFA